MRHRPPRRWSSCRACDRPTQSVISVCRDCQRSPSSRPTKSCLGCGGIHRSRDSDLCQRCEPQDPFPVALHNGRWVRDGLIHRWVTNEIKTRETSRETSITAGHAVNRRPHARRGPAEEGSPMSNVHATMDGAKNEATRTADRANGRHMARVSPPTSSEERKRLMLSIPPTPDAPSTCVDVHPDGCPNCVVNVEEPWFHERGDNGCSAAYICSDCGWQWNVAWGCR